MVVKQINSACDMEYTCIWVQFTYFKTPFFCVSLALFLSLHDLRSEQTVMEETDSLLVQYKHITQSPIIIKQRYPQRKRERGKSLFLSFFLVSSLYSQKYLCSAQSTSRVSIFFFFGIACLALTHSAVEVSLLGNQGSPTLLLLSAMKFPSKHG